MVPGPVLPFLLGHIPFVLGAILAIALIGVRAASTDPAFRNDLRGAVLLFLSFLVTRTATIWAQPYVSPRVEKLLVVAWMLLFTFGCIRTLVSTVLWVFRSNERPTPKILRDVIDFILYAGASVFVLRSELNVDLTGLVATSAVLSIVLGFALQDTLGNLFAGLSIQLERPFQVGDMVEIGSHRGRVVQVAWRATRLETRKRELITLPNNVLSKEAVKAFTRREGPVGVEVDLGLSYDAAPNHVKETILDVVRDIPGALTEPQPTVRVINFADSAIQYRVRFYVPDYGQNGAALDEFYSRLWYRLRRENIEIPYPTHTVHSRADMGQQADLDVETVSELLRTVDLFAMLPDRDRNTLAREMQPRRFGRGERVIEAGANGQTFYVVASGEVSVRAGKSEVEVARLRSGQYFGEMSLLTGEPRAATVIAANDAILLEVDRPVFARLFAEHPGLARQLSALLAHRRSQLRAAAEATGTTDAVPEAGRIFGRLRAIFGLSHD